jgi:hypothetical protein
MISPVVEDDRPHSPDQGSAWIETWAFDYFDRVNETHGWVQLTHQPAAGLAWYVSATIGPDGRLVIVVDPALRLQSLKPSLEFRAEGLWAQHVCETPMEHWTVGLEAFGVRLEDPTEALVAEAWGDRIGVGLDVEWEAAGQPVGGHGCFRQPCTVSGELLLGDLEFDLQAVGNRYRAWGPDALAQMAELAPRTVAPDFGTPVRVLGPMGDVELHRQLDLSVGWSLRLTA